MLVTLDILAGDAGGAFERAQMEYEQMRAFFVHQRHAVARKRIQDIAQRLEVGPHPDKDRIVDGHHQWKSVPQTLVGLTEEGQSAAVAVILLVDISFNSGAVVQLRPGPGPTRAGAAAQADIRRSCGCVGPRSDKH